MDSKVTGAVAVKAVEVSIWVVAAVVSVAAGWMANSLWAKHKDQPIIRRWRNVTPAKGSAEPVEVKEAVEVV